MLEGDLSEELNLSADRKERIRRSAAKSLEYLTDKTHEIEQYMLDEIVSKVDEPSQKKLKAALGQPIKNAPANIQLMLMLLPIQ